ncbi:MAG: response regulator, partial [Bdellovibrionaceae bacterium]|nr:response regulator [Pseudobdellovibrionaceae bacterium]
MKQNCRILIIDDEAPIRQIMEGALKDEGHQVEVASDGASGLDKLKSFQPEIVFLDIWMPGMDGLEVLTKAKALWPQAEYVMISGHGTIETAVKATKLGAWDFIEKPLSTDKIHIVIQNIVQFRSEREEKAALLTTLRKSIALIGEAPEIVQLKQQISRVAPSESWILIFGEMGSGKNLVAQNIHYMSPRAGRPFVEINCRAIPEDLQEA